MRAKFASALVGILVLMAGCAPLTPVPEAQDAEESAAGEVITLFSSSPEVKRAIENSYSAEEIKVITDITGAENIDIFIFPKEALLTDENVIVVSESEYTEQGKPLAAIIDSNTSNLFAPVPVTGESGAKNASVLDFSESLRVNLLPNISSTFASTFTQSISQTGRFTLDYGPSQLIVCPDCEILGIYYYYDEILKQWVCEETLQ